MTYVEGFVLAVPTAERDAYRQHAEDFQPMFARVGVRRVVECWGDDVPEGKVTDFRKAVQATDEETIVFSWFEYPDRAARDAATAKMTADPDMEKMSASEMPFDGKRMIISGFDSIVDEGTGRGGYIDGVIAPVPLENKEAYRAMAQKGAGIFQEYGAVRVVEAWGDDVTDGKVTDYKRAVKAEPHENVVYSWIEWPDKAARDAGWAQVMADDRMKPPAPMPFDGKRMFWGGFTPILDR
jgi:uncharacterized protein YbaA (DUF1428 family)